MGSVPTAVVERLTDEPTVAHLGTCRNGRPHVAPVWFLYEDDVIKLVTAGRKLSDIRANPYVSLSVERSITGNPEWMVSLRGTATVIDDDDRFQDTNRRINRKYGVPESAWASENTLVHVDIGSASYSTY